MALNAPRKALLREQRGLSIMQYSKKHKIKTDTLTDRTVRTPHLDDSTMANLKALHPYICDAPYANIPFNELVYHFRCDTYPEGEVFWWQLHVISVIHALKLWTNPALAIVRHPPPKSSALGDQVTLDRYLSFPKEMRKQFHFTVFMLLMVPEDFSLDTPEDLCILQASKDVFESLAEESADIEKGRALRYARAYGSVCASCKNMGKGKMVCSRCNRAFYCGRECQKADWPEHKKVCGKQIDKDIRAAKRPPKTDFPFFL